MIAVTPMTFVLRVKRIRKIGTVAGDGLAQNGDKPYTTNSDHWGMYAWSSLNEAVWYSEEQINIG